METFEGCRVVKNVLIIKLSSIGDVVHSLPFLEVVKRHFPEAQIDWVVEEESSQIVMGHAAIRRLIVSRRKAWIGKLKQGVRFSPVFGEAARFLKELRRVEYDLIIDLQGLLKSGILAGLARGKKKIGMSSAREGAGLFLSERAVPVDYNQHAVDRYLQVARYLKCDCSAWNGNIPVSAADMERIRRLVHGLGSGQGPLVAVNPIARWRTKLWDAERFAILADRLCNELSCCIVFTGGGRDRGIIQEICSMMANRSVNLAGRTTLKELACLYFLCRLVVTTDTGPMHIAAAMGCPVVALFGPTDPGRTGPYGPGHAVITADLECRPCFKRNCDHVSCMKQITVDQCFETVRDMLS